MKNDYCILPQEEIHRLPGRFKGFLLSPFQHNLKNGYVFVPEGAFKEMTAIIAEYASVADRLELAAVPVPRVGGNTSSKSSDLAPTPAPSGPQDEREESLRFREFVVRCDSGVMIQPWDAWLARAALAAKAPQPSEVAQQSPTKGEGQ